VNGAFTTPDELLLFFKKAKKSTPSDIAKVTRYGHQSEAQFDPKRAKKCFFTSKIVKKRICRGSLRRSPETPDFKGFFRKSTPIERNVILLTNSK
jgi:hypothetical protein